MNSYILSTALSFGQQQGRALPDVDAPKYIAKAIYKQQGLDKVVSRLEKKYINLDEYPELGYIGVVVKIINEKRISWEWEF